MKKLIATTLGVVLAAGAVSASAGSQDRENLAQCKADVKHYLLLIYLIYCVYQII